MTDPTKRILLLLLFYSWRLTIVLMVLFFVTISLQVWHLTGEFDILERYVTVLMLVVGSFVTVKESWKDTNMVLARAEALK